MPTETPLKEQEDNLSEFPEEDHDKPESEASGKASSSDSGIEDGKSTPTSEEDTKVVESSEPELPLLRTADPSESSESSSDTMEQPSAASEKPEEPEKEAHSGVKQPYTMLDQTESKEPDKRVSVVSDRSSLGGEDAESLVPHTNGRLSKRYSDVGSENMDMSQNLSGHMSVNKDLGTITLWVSLCLRVCLHDTDLIIQTQQSSLMQASTDFPSNFGFCR